MFDPLGLEGKFESEFWKNIDQDKDPDLKRSQLRYGLLLRDWEEYKGKTLDLGLEYNTERTAKKQRTLSDAAEDLIVRSAVHGITPRLGMEAGSPRDIKVDIITSDYMAAVSSDWSDNHRIQAFFMRNSTKVEIAAMMMPLLGRGGRLVIPPKPSATSFERLAATTGLQTEFAGGGVIKIIHPANADAFIMGRVSGTNLELMNVHMPFEMRGKGLSKQLYQALVKEAGDIRSISGELMHTNKMVIRDLVDEGLSAGQAAALTPSARARAAAGFTQHSYDAATRILTSSKP